MIVGCYSLDLYCDHPNPPPGRHEWDEFPYNVTDEFGKKCRKKARRAGWILCEETGLALCPKCVAAGDTIAVLKDHQLLFPEGAR